jgi:hypothetical protein
LTGQLGALTLVGRPAPYATAADAPARVASAFEKDRIVNQGLAADAPGPEFKAVEVVYTRR